MQHHHQMARDAVLAKEQPLAALLPRSENPAAGVGVSKGYETRRLRQFSDKDEGVRAGSRSVQQDHVRRGTHRRSTPQRVRVLHPPLSPRGIHHRVARFHQGWELVVPVRPKSLSTRGLKKAPGFTHHDLKGAQFQFVKKRNIKIKICFKKKYASF